MAPPRQSISPSVARSLDAGEVSELAATAKALPDGWVVAVLPPHGQLTITPREQLRAYHRCHVADSALGVVYRADYRGIRVPPVAPVTLQA